jgi:histidinol-phosphate aminotransferase
MGCSALIPAVAARLGVPESHVATGTGGVGVIQQVMQAVCDDRDQVVYPWRSFEAYPIITKMVGAHPVQVPLTADEYQDLDAIAAAVTDHTRLVILCNPNNPTGTALHRAELTEFLDRVPSDVLVLIDEAYREFVRDPEVPDGIELYRDRPNVAVLRTFSKAYGLAGLRVGYAVAHEPVADALRKMAVPFGVSQLAQDAAIASLAAEDELFERVELITKERGRVIDALRDQGWTVPTSEGNFVWLRLGERTMEFAELAQAAGVMVRPFAGEGVRVSIGEVDGNDLFLGVAAAFRS